MKKNLIVFLFLFVCSIGVCSAESWTVILAPKNPVQCNHWGWVTGNVQTVWKNSCTPLELKGRDGTIYTIETTINQCPPDQAAIYNSDGHSKPEFTQCYDIPNEQAPKNLR